MLYIVTSGCNGEYRRWIVKTTSADDAKVAIIKRENLSPFGVWSVPLVLDRDNAAELPREEAA